MALPSVYRFYTCLGLALFAPFASSMAEADVAVPVCEDFSPAILDIHTSVLNVGLASIPSDRQVYLEGLSFKPATRELPLSIVVFPDSGMEADALEVEMAVTNRILLQCGVRLGSVTLVQARIAAGVSTIYSNYPGRMEADLARQLPPALKPAIVYVRKFDDFDGCTSRQCGSYRQFGRANIAAPSTFIEPSSLITDPSRQNFIWINMDRFSESLASDVVTRNNLYVVRQHTESHEIVHLLTKQGHNSLAGNLMGRMSGPSNSLDDQQCARIMESALLRHIQIK